MKADSALEEVVRLEWVAGELVAAMARSDDRRQVLRTWWFPALQGRGVAWCGVIEGVGFV